MLKYSLGLDISSKEIHCCLSTIDSSQRVSIKKVVARLQIPLKVLRILRIGLYFIESKKRFRW